MKPPNPLPKGIPPVELLNFEYMNEPTSALAYTGLHLFQAHEVSLEAILAPPRDVSTPTEEKKRLRQHFRSLRNQEPAADESAIWKQLRVLENQLSLTEGRSILAFVGVCGELQTLDELERRRSSGQPVYVPRCEGSSISEGRMEFYAFTGRHNLVKGPYGLSEPPPQCPFPSGGCMAGPIIWVPGLAFDRAGRRLGQGGGFYDRYLVRQTVHNALRIGLCHDYALVEDAKLPTEATDQRVHWLVTPTQVIKTSFGDRAY